jgi:3-hydroxy-9,10-secoandrosta-1,3,5(10)-triene-9,17-dione monooxygenase
MSIDHDEIMRRVAAISPVLERNTRACDSARQLAPESLAAMVNAGMFRISQPSRNGGYELSLRTLADAVTAISQACPSCGWVLMVAGAHHWCMGSFPEAEQDEVFGGGRDVLIAGTLSWQGVAVSVDGGYRVDGRWQFGSGVDHSQWVMLGCADAETGGPKVHVVARREELEIDDTWHVMGLRAPAARTWSRAACSFPRIARSTRGFSFARKARTASIIRPTFTGCRPRRCCRCR